MKASLSLLSVAFLLLSPGPIRAVTVDMSPVVNANDPGQTGNPGVVPYSFALGTYEVTNVQYAAFLNAVAKADPYALYNAQMASSAQGGILRSGADGSYVYSVKAGRENHPVNFVSLFDAWRFVNWLTNGQPTGPQGDGTTETGVYILNGNSSLAGFSADFSAWAEGAYVLPSSAEWYKAAYFDRESGTFFDYPGTNQAPLAEAPPGGSNSANYLNVVGDLTAAGAYTQSTGPYGTYDQAGNVEEWVDAINIGNNTAVLRGGTYNREEADVARWNFVNADPASEEAGKGFRIARKMWGPYGFVVVGYVDSGERFGPLYVPHDPWVWSPDLGKWMYIDSSKLGEKGAWVYVPK